LSNSEKSVKCWKTKHFANTIDQTCTF
jgi:hypothetical protein